MDQKEQDISTLTTLMQRFTDYRLPRAERLLERVNAGEKVTDYDLRWLKTIYKDSMKTRDLVRRNPEYHKLVARVIDLYAQITQKALENEQTG